MVVGETVKTLWDRCKEDLGGRGKECNCGGYFLLSGQEITEQLLCGKELYPGG